MGLDRIRDGLGACGRALLGSAALGCIALSLACGEEPAPPAPHVIVILADDLGLGDVGWTGTGLPTPALERLASRGQVLERLYASPVCTPSRAALLTGRHPHRYGLQAGVIRPFSAWGLPESERTLAERLRERGYRTALIGKWHLGHASRAMLPTSRGFERQYGSYNGAIDHWSHERLGGLDWHRDDRACREPGYDTDLLGSEALRLIEAHDPAEPLFLLLAFTAPHAPLQAPPEELLALEGIPDLTRRVHAAMVARMDRWIGRLLEALEERGMLEHALIVFASDNGADEEFGGSNGALRGGKKDLYEGALRVPGIVLWPGGVPSDPGGTLSEPVHLVDIAPTALALAGLALPPELDGLDLAPLVRGGSLGREELVLHVEPERGALLLGALKLVADGPLLDETRAPRCALYDLEEDPGESRDLALERPADVARLLALLRAHAREQAPPRGGAFDEREEGFRAPPVWGEAE